MKRGFTLIELLVVVLIIGILSAVALPQYQKSVDKANAIEMKNFLNAYSKAQKLYFLQNNTYGNLEDLESTGIKMPELKNFEITKSPYHYTGEGSFVFNGIGPMEGISGSGAIKGYNNSYPNGIFNCTDAKGRCLFLSPCGAATNHPGYNTCYDPW